MKDVLKELQDTIMVEDPCCYSLPQDIRNSIVQRQLVQHQLYFVAVYKDSDVDRNCLLDSIYWNKVEYSYLPQKYLSYYSIVWYEFKGKHIQHVN